MAEEAIQEVEETEATPQGEVDGTDWKAEARKWERYAKKAQAAEAELERLKQSQMTEQEKEKARADAAEAKLAALQAEQERTEAARRIAQQTGVPLEMLLFCSDEDAMSDFAKKYTENTHVASAPNALSGSRVVRGNDKPADNGELFAEFAQTLFNK